eukprot:3020981-Lingulodinium_polyedra.AAC.1
MESLESASTTRPGGRLSLAGLGSSMSRRGPLRRALSCSRHGAFALLRPSSPIGSFGPPARWPI